MLNKIRKNDLFDYPNRYIYQDLDGFKFSLDSILLAEFVKIHKNDQLILDMCTGNAPIPLILSTRTSLPIYAFEIQKEIAHLADLSIKENNLTEQITLVNDDVLNLPSLFPGKYFDIITCNPPYFTYANKQELNKSDLKTIARHEVLITLDNIFALASAALKETGSFYLVHRPERIDEIIITATKYKLKLKELQVVVTGENHFKIILMRFQKHGNYGVKINDIINVSNLSSYQNIFRKE